MSDPSLEMQDGQSTGRRTNKTFRKAKSANPSKLQKGKEGKQLTTPIDQKPTIFNPQSSQVVNFALNKNPYMVNVGQRLPLIDKTVYETIFSHVEFNTENQIKTKNQPQPSFSIVDDYEPRPPVKISPEYIQAVNVENDEYTMDEEDFDWLEKINKRKADTKQFNFNVSEDDFELFMNRLEHDSVFEVDYTFIKKSEVSKHEAHCSICLRADSHSSNLILFCNLCTVPVHQACYGVHHVPKEQWLCKRCFNAPSLAVYCIFCPNGGGAFKETVCGRWAHMICAIWIPEVYFLNEVFLDSIAADRIPKGRQCLKCCICKKAGGVCITCKETKCWNSFHITCAVMAGLHMEVIESKKYVKGLPCFRKNVYCERHRKCAGQDQIDLLNTKAGNLVYNPDKKSCTIVALPTLAEETIQNIIGLVDFPGKNEFFTKLIEYWKEKRESRNGKPLIRIHEYIFQNKIGTKTPKQMPEENAASMAQIETNRQ